MAASNWFGWNVAKMCKLKGLPRDLSQKLAAMSLFGAAKMFLETGEHPAILKEAVQSPGLWKDLREDLKRVCSSGGSTIYGIHELEKGGLRGLLINAVEAASERSRRTGEAALPHSRTSVIYRSEI